MSLAPVVSLPVAQQRMLPFANTSLGDIATMRILVVLLVSLALPTIAFDQNVHPQEHLLTRAANQHSTGSTKQPDSRPSLRPVRDTVIYQHQSIANRPKLEVNYADSSRSSFNILAEEYRLTGELNRPHRLVSDNGEPWLWFEIHDKSGTVYSTQHSPQPSRINLYRRGPYYCEIHWFDLQPSTAEGTPAPLKGDLALFCYPEKILAEITWHGTGALDADHLTIKGIVPRQFPCSPFEAGTRQAFAFPLFGEEAPLADDAFTLITGEVPVHYDARRGCYVVGTVTSGSFQRQFYETPNRYEAATITLRNDATPRKIYICHESVVGGGIVEGGTVLDQDGHPMPIVVQVSKNFAGEKEEKFYNPNDTPFSETFFPINVRPHQTMTLTSLHLYQNWGRHMTKHWSSLGAWMDYFHSSTGVTETTCYVPFKFGGIGGVSIADFRAMSQETFWNGQPQHDNLAGHSFLSFFDGQNWQHAKYERTVYRSTGPNWYDIQLQYVSADGSIKVTADIWETPQADELRSFFHVRYDVLKPLVVEDAKAHFRLLSVASAVQQLRFTRFAASGADDLPIDFTQAPFPIKGMALPSKNAYMAVYGDHARNRGSNAIVVRDFSGPRGIGPAATLQVGPYRDRYPSDRTEDTRLLLVPDVERLELQPGDVFDVDGFWLPYGSRDDARTPRREAVAYGHESPHVVDCKRGTVLSHLPVRIHAEMNRAEFTVTGGTDLLPIVVTGMTDWRYPRIWRKEKERWRLLSHARNTDHDGYQVFCDETGDFGTVFLVGSDRHEQTLKVSMGESVPDGEQLALEVQSSRDSTASPPAVTFAEPGDGVVYRVLFPTSEERRAAGTPVATTWKSSEGGSLWFESSQRYGRRGGRIHPNQDDLDLEYWWQNEEGQVDHEAPAFVIDFAETPFSDPRNERTWILTTEGWQRFGLQNGEARTGAGAIAVTSVDGERNLCMAWPHARGVFAPGDGQMGVILQPVRFPRSRRYHLRGKIYLIDGDRETLADRISKDNLLRTRGMPPE